MKPSVWRPYRHALWDRSQWAMQCQGHSVAVCLDTEVSAHMRGSENLRPLVVGSCGSLSCKAHSS